SKAVRQAELSHGEGRKVTVLRGKDGFGFTICSDSPVRIQAVDPGKRFLIVFSLFRASGPADQAGLQKSDTVLQLNGQPVKHWKCVDLAYAIRNSLREITVVVWRTGLSVKTQFEGLIHNPSYKYSNYDTPASPAKVKRSEKVPPVPPLPTRHRIVAHNGSEIGGRGAGGLWEETRRAPEVKPGTQTLRGTRVKAANGDNYIILSPINAGNQVLGSGDTQRTQTGQMYSSPHTSEVTGAQSVPSLGTRTCFLRQHGNSKPKTSPNYQHSGSFANYQNCTIMRSHAPHPKVTAKILIFPIFVQPIDLCSPMRTLLLTEEMVLYESKHFSIKVTVFIYSDLMLVTREDNSGRCNVLQNPLYLRQLQLQE
ncbi:hypothetical protein DNTS_004218, partial [Danionella cerebrum]